MFPDWHSKNAPVIQLLLILLGVKEKGEGVGGLKERGVNKFLAPKRGGGAYEREGGAYLRGGLNRGFTIFNRQYTIGW